jgi:hypothetical protein
MNEQEIIKDCFICLKRLDKWNASWNTFYKPICGNCCLLTINNKIKQIEKDKETWNQQ